MTITEIRIGLKGNTIFPLGYAEDLHADLYSVHIEDNDIKGTGKWAIYILGRNDTTASMASIGTFTGLTLQQYMEGK